MEPDKKSSSKRKKQTQIKNMLRIFKAEISKNVKNTEPQAQKLYSYKK